METINGWLLVYLIGSLPVLAFYAAGLSGWFFDYPIWLFVAIFLIPCNAWHHKTGNEGNVLPCLSAVSYCAC